MGSWVTVQRHVVFCLSPQLTLNRCYEVLLSLHWVLATQISVRARQHSSAWSYLLSLSPHRQTLLQPFVHEFASEVISSRVSTKQEQILDIVRVSRQLSGCLVKSRKNEGGRVRQQAAFPEAQKVLSARSYQPCMLSNETAIRLMFITSCILQRRGTHISMEGQSRRAA